MKLCTFATHCHSLQCRTGPELAAKLFRYSFVYLYWIFVRWANVMKEYADRTIYLSQTFSTTRYCGTVATSNKNFVVQYYYITMGYFAIVRTFMAINRGMHGDPCFTITGSMNQLFSALQMWWMKDESMYMHYGELIYIYIIFPVIHDITSMDFAPKFNVRYYSCDLILHWKTFWIWTSSP